MSAYVGRYPLGSIVTFLFTTHSAAGSPIAPLTSFEAADLVIYKETLAGSSSEKATANGVTMTSPFDSTTGLHKVTINTANNTGDASFWANDATYHVLLNPNDETVDNLTILKVVATFQVETQTKDLWQIHGLDPSNAVTANTTVRASGTVSQAITGDGTTTTTLTRT